MSEPFYYSKSGFAPYSDGSGFRVTVTIEQETETSEPTISFDDIWRLPVLKSSAKDAPLSKILSHWLVHGKPPKRHHRVKVVNG